MQNISVVPLSGQPTSRLITECGPRRRCLYVSRVLTYTSTVQALHWTSCPRTWASAKEQCKFPQLDATFQDRRQAIVRNSLLSCYEVRHACNIAIRATCISTSSTKRRSPFLKCLESLCQHGKVIFRQRLRYRALISFFSTIIFCWRHVWELRRPFPSR